MTGNVLKRLREAYGLKQADVARVGGTIYKALDNIERGGVSYSRSHGASNASRNNHRQRQWRAIIAAMRALLNARAEREAEARRKQEAEERKKRAAIPRGTTHMRDGEPVRVVMMHGRMRGFLWDGGWLRSARVEDAAGKAVAV